MADTPTSAAAMTALHELLRLKGMDAVIDYHYQMAQSPTPSPARERHEAEHDRLVAIRNAAEPAAWEAARAALAQAASAQVEAVQAQPTSAPTGEPSETQRLTELLVQLRERCAETAEADARCNPEDSDRIAEAIRAIELDVAVRLYVAPQPAAPAQTRMPLSEEEIYQLATNSGFGFFGKWQLWQGNDAHLFRFARVIEAAHGIAGESSRATNGVKGTQHG